MARLPPCAGRSRPRGVFAKAPEAGLRGPAAAGSGLSGLARVMDVIVLFRPWGWTTRAGWEGLFTRGNECRQPRSSWEKLVPGWDVWGRKTVSHGELPAIWWWVCSARLWSGIQAGTLWETPWGHTGPLRSAVGYSVSFPNPMGSWGSAVLGMLWGGRGYEYRHGDLLRATDSQGSSDSGSGSQATSQGLTGPHSDGEV